MPFRLVRSDIILMKTDAIVSAASPDLSGGGGADERIRRAAGPGLTAECRKLGGCRVGEAKLTGAYRLGAKYIIHTVGPVWQGGTAGEEEALVSCYRACLKLAAEKGCQSIAFPLLSTGHHGYPRAEAIRIACETLSAAPEAETMDISLVLYDRESFDLSLTAAGPYAKEIEQFIDDRYVEDHPDLMQNRRFFASSKIAFSMMDAEAASLADAKEPTDPLSGMVCEEAMEESPHPVQPEPMVYSRPEAFRPSAPAAVPLSDAAEGTSLEERLSTVGESFSQMLLRKIDERGMTDAECYRKANIDRRHFSKIRSDRAYRPSKSTALALGIALELPLDELKELLGKAGFALSDASKADIIVEFFVRRRNYDLLTINETLFAYHQDLLA